MTSVEPSTVDQPSSWTADGFREVYEAYAPKLYRFCLHLTHCRDTAEDLAVETLAAAYQGRARFRGGSRVETWLFGIAVNRYKLWCRRQGPRHESLADVDPHYEPTLMEDSALALALQGLPRNLLIPVLLVKGEGLTHREAGDVLGIPTGTVQFRVFQAMRLLRSQLSEEGFRAEKRKPEMRCEHEL